MGYKWMGLLAVGLAVLGTGCAAEGNKPAATSPAATTQPAARTSILETQKDKVSYGVGVSIGRSFQQQGIDDEVDLDRVIQGLRDTLANHKLDVPESELHRISAEFQIELRRKQIQKRRILGDDNKKEGQAFLEQNKAKEGVVTLPSGLQYKVLKQGNGPVPKATDFVECHYRGTLVNGKEFDNSYTRGQPMTFKANTVMPGWTEALQIMPVGSKYILFIPPDLAYGARGAGRDIGPYATLIFEVETLAIKPPVIAGPPTAPAPPQ